MHLEDRFVPGLLAVRSGRSADTRLVEQLRRGDAEAGRRFVHELYPGIFRYLLYLCGSRDMAEDLTQETFVQAWRSLAALENGERLRSWLYRIAHREFLQAMRAAPPVVSFEALPAGYEPRALDDTQAVELRAILAALPTEEREMVVLHYLEGYNSEEVAGIMGVPAGTVRYRLSEARARLRRELSDPEPQQRERKRR